MINMTLLDMFINYLTLDISNKKTLFYLVFKILLKNNIVEKTIFFKILGLSSIGFKFCIFTYIFWMT